MSFSARGGLVRFSGHVHRLRGGEGKARAGPRHPYPTVVVLGVALALLLLSASPSRAAETSGIGSVSISRQFFNPTLGQKAEISFSVGSSGSLTLLVLDRDGYVVRKLVSEKPVQKGKHSFAWDGRDDDAGDVVPDEAYSFKIGLASKNGKVQTYFPANSPAEQFSVKATYYDRRGATLAYKLPKPSRVHIQAGVARIDPERKEPKGPVLKTVVNREPRVGGSVIETWNGLDESGTIRVSDLPNFAMAIAATPLPENSVITVGNHSVRFLDQAAERAGQSLFTYSVKDHHHHRGLSALEDVAPALRLKPRNAIWSSTERLWTPQGESLKLSVLLDGPSAKTFARQPGHLFVYVDQEVVSKAAGGLPAMDLEIPLGKLSSGPHTVTVDWASDYGPVAVNSLRLRIAPSEGLSPAAFKRQED